MKKLLLISCLLLNNLPASAIEPQAVAITETAQELELKKNKFLAITEKDLVQYESIVRQIDRDKSAGAEPSKEFVGFKNDFDSFADRRLNMIRKVFAVFRNEFEMILKFVEPLPAERLPAFNSLLAELDSSLSEAKMKGSKDKWLDLKDRSSKLLKKSGDAHIRRQYEDGLILGSDDSKAVYFAAKIGLLHRWLLEGMFNDVTPWLEELAGKYPDNQLCLGLQAHYWLEDYSQCIGALDFKAELEKKISQQFGGGMVVSITLKGEKSLQKAYLFYLEALKRGFPEDREIPGLMPAYWQYIEVLYNKVHPYWRYPDRLAGFRDLLKDLTERCRSVVMNVPFKKYASPAYQILSDVYKYWPESKLGAKIIDYREIMNLSRIVAGKKH